MKDLDFITVWKCTGGTGERIVLSESGNIYTVFISNDVSVPHRCDCPHFAHRRLNKRFETCKHIDAALKDKCGWNSFLTGGEPVEVDGEKRCPRCGGQVMSIEVIV